MGMIFLFFFFQAEDGIRDDLVTGVQTCALPISRPLRARRAQPRLPRLRAVRGHPAGDAGGARRRARGCAKALRTPASLLSSPAGRTLRGLRMSFNALFRPFEDLDAWLTGLFSGAPLLVALAISFALGLRHASDPDHLVAVTSLLAADGGDTRGAARLGFWWGVGHAGTLLVVGLPLIFLKSSLPAWLETGAERAVGLVILILALRVIWKWLRGDYRVDGHAHEAAEPHGTSQRHLQRGPAPRHRHVRVRTPHQALSIGMLHGLAGTGAVVLLLIAALPSQLEAAAALDRMALWASGPTGSCVPAPPPRSVGVSASQLTPATRTTTP